MTGITTNYSQLSALRNLQSVNKQLDQTQNRISTGLKINSAKDGASQWSAATKMRADISSYRALSDGLDYYKSTADVVSGAAESIVNSLNDMKSLITQYANTSDATEQATIYASIQSAEAQIKSALAAGQVKGATDWLSATTTVTANIGYDSTGAAVTDTLTKVDVDTAVTATAIGGGAAGITSITTADIDTAGEVTATQTAIDTAITTVTAYAAKLGSFADRLGDSQAFLDKIADVKQSSLSDMVDADLEEESAKLSALQVQQQLAIQALQISNASAQNILRLFQ
ncbi:flagellin [Aurantimonas sp. MSK8Z-1]|uniref:flagellin n=1 Tax=Mangrovibrevibacter kandeliae TaxID=2968473 RepID=UPI00211772E4|nr:flagellin [Aurantimonas sp. MSK8Z-1]MCW4113705.1 flagellin [Aurantimonas sp. MSK8Z-1]